MPERNPPPSPVDGPGSPWSGRRGVTAPAIAPLIMLRLLSTARPYPRPGLGCEGNPPLAGVNDQRADHGGLGEPGCCHRVSHIRLVCAIYAHVNCSHAAIITQSGAMRQGIVRGRPPPVSPSNPPCPRS